MTVYTGFVTDITDIDKLHHCINNFREELKQRALNKLTEYYAKACIYKFDKRTLYPETAVEGVSVLQEVNTQFHELHQQVRQSGVKEPSIDYSFNMVFYPFEGKLYGSMYTVQSDFAELWLNKNFVKEYAYWNNTDQPENISDKAWQKRGRVWDTIFETQAIPSLNGFTYEITPEQSYDMPVLEDIISILPTLSERASYMATDAMHDSFLSKRKVSNNNMIKIHKSFVEYKNSDEGKTEFNTLEDNIIKRLSLVVGQPELIKV